MSATPALAASPALLTGDASRVARPLLRWTDADLAVVAGAMAEAVTRVAKRWDNGARPHAAPGAAGPAAVHAEDADAAARRGTWTAIGAHARWSLDADPAQCLHAAFFGEASPGPGAREGRLLADELADECWAEQLAAVRALLGETAAAPPACAVEGDAWRRWSGAVLVSLPWLGHRWRLLVDATAVRALLGRRAAVRAAAADPPRDAPMPVLRALHDTPVALQARLAPFELDLGSLVGLAVGDVLRLAHRIDEPVRVVAANAPVDALPLCIGWLGRRDDAALGIELERASPPPTIR